MEKYKVIFFGTPLFSVEFLKALIDAPFLDVVAVVTEPDRPKGRGKILCESAVANFIKEIIQKTPQNNKNISILKPDKISTYNLNLKTYNCDLFVVVAYGQIIPQAILEIPKYGAINVHPSDLPRYRGPAPIQGVLLNGEKETAISIMKMDAKMDHGPIINKLPLTIDENDDYFSLEKKILDKGPQFLIISLKKLLDSPMSRSKNMSQIQDHSKATFTNMIKKEDGLIDWAKSPAEIHNKIRAFSSWPKTYTYLCSPVGCTVGKRLNILKSKIEHGKLTLESVQLEGKKPTSWKEFTNGYAKIIPEKILKNIN